MTSPVAAPGPSTPSLQPESPSALHLQLDPSGAWTVTGAGCTLTARMDAPVAEGLSPRLLRFDGVEEVDSAIGGVPGRLRVDRAGCGEFEVERHSFVAFDHGLIALRLAVRNRGNSPRRLESLVPLVIHADEACRIAGSAAPDWRFVRLGRQKSDIPGDFSFRERNSNLRDATLDASKLVAGMGADLEGIANAFRSDGVAAEPAFYVKSLEHPANPGLLFGMLGQHDHLTTFLLRPDRRGDRVEEIRCRCEFDGVVMDPGDTRRTHWLVLRPVPDESRAFLDFTELFAAEFQLAPPRRTPLAVYCTWQFYAFEFYPADLDELLAALARRPMPIDVIQLDNGWITAEGDWEANHRFPQGMRVIADRIRSAGYIAGIWTCPLVLLAGSEMFRRHPDLAARRRDGSLAEYKYVGGLSYAVDPTSPHFRPYILGLYAKLKDWGFQYHKLDFLRSIIVDDDIRFHDPKVNRAQAYRLANEVLREALGDAYFASCGGVFDGGNGNLPDSVRTSADTYGFWHNGDSEKDALTRLKENVIRSYLNRLVRTDPDAACLRRRTTIFRRQRLDRHNVLNFGHFTDEEAFTIVASHYWAGGNVTVCDRLAELDEDRRQLYRHIIPSAAAPARILDWHREKAPNLFFTEVRPPVPGLEPWWTLGVCNWGDEPVLQPVDLGRCPLPASVERLAVFEFRGQTFEGIRARSETLTLCIPPHATRLLRLAPWDGRHPVLLGTDLHLTGGGVEIERIDIEERRISGTIATKWQYPVSLTGLFPFEDRGKVQRTWVGPGQRDFVLENR